MSSYLLSILVEAEDKASAVLGGIGSAIAGVGKVGLAVAGGGIAALGGALVAGVMDARDAAKVMAVTEQTIKTMGGASGVSAQHVADFAASLSAAAGKSLFGDSQIQEASNLLLTFGEIKGETLDLATVLTTDLATALGGAPRDHAMMLGKALNDPVKGITALGKAGLTFSEEQKAAIAAMVETDNIAGAQSIIIAELNKQVGGQAEAAAKADGGWAQFKDRLGEAAETVGALLLPALNLAVGFLNDSVMPTVEAVASLFASAFGEGGGGFNALLKGIQQLTGIDLSPFVAAIQGLVPVVMGAIQPIIAAFTDAKNPVDGFLSVLAQISPTFALVKAALDAALPPIQTIITTVFGIIGGFLTAHGAKISADLTFAWQQIQAIVNAVIPPIQAIISTVFGLIAAFLQEHGAEIQATLQMAWDTIALVIQAALALIKATIVPAVKFIASLLSAHSTEIKNILSIAWGIIRTVITTVLGVIQGIIRTVLAVIKGDWQGAWTAIKGVAQTIWEGIKTLLKLNLDLITAIFKLAWDGIKAYFSGALTAIKTLFVAVWNDIKAFFQGILDGMVGWVIQTFQGILNAIRGFAGQARATAGGVADAIVSGISSGISSGAGKIISAAKDAAMEALNAAKRALGISSPSKMFREVIGQNAGTGFALGLRDTIPTVTRSATDLANASVQSAATTITNNHYLTYHGMAQSETDVRAALRAEALLTGALA